MHRCFPKCILMVTLRQKQGKEIEEEAKQKVVKMETSTVGTKKNMSNGLNIA